MMNTETIIWKASPSQLTKIGTYLLCLILAIGAIALGVFLPPFGWILLVVPAGIALWTYLVVRCQVYELTTQRLRFYYGVFNRKIDELELYRIKDSSIEQPFQLRIFGLGNVYLETSDRTHPVAALRAVRNVQQVRDDIRDNVEKLRDQKGVREVDYDAAGGGADLDAIGGGGPVL